MAAGSGMENIQALIPNVGEWEAACTEEGSLNILLLEKPAHGRCEATQMHTHRERERERHKELYLF